VFTCDCDGNVCIFKNELKNEVSSEIEDLQKIGIPAANIYHIPLKWKDMGPIEDSCVQVIAALVYIECYTIAGVSIVMGMRLATR